MEDILELLSRWQTICIWNLPSEFTKPQLRTYFEEKGFVVRHVFLLPREDFTEAAVQLANAGDVVRIVNSEHNIDGTRINVTPATAQVRSVNALINQSWMENPRVKEAVDQLMDVKVERKKDGVHLIAPLQRIIQIEERLRNLLVERVNPVSERVLRDNWQLNPQEEAPTLAEVSDQAEGFEEMSAENAEAINRMLAEDCEERPEVPTKKSPIRRRRRNQRRKKYSFGSPNRPPEAVDPFAAHLEDYLRRHQEPEQPTDLFREIEQPIAEPPCGTQDEHEEPTSEDLLLINQILDEDSFLAVAGVAEEEPTEPRAMTEDTKVSAEEPPGLTLVKPMIMKVIKAPAMIEKPRPHYSCDLCLTAKESVFVCPCDFEVCEECKGFNTCPKCGDTFDAATTRE